MSFLVDCEFIYCNFSLQECKTSHVVTASSRAPLEGSASMSTYPRGQRWRRPERTREHRRLLVPSLSCSQMGGEVTGVSQHKANCRTFAQTQKRNQLRYTSHNYKH